MKNNNLKEIYVEAQESFEFKTDLLNKAIKQIVPVYIFGTNEFAVAIAEKIVVQGFINDLSADFSFHGKPVLKLNDISQDAIVISCVVLAKPLFAIEKIKIHTPNVLDYFFFRKYSNFDLPNVIFSNDQDFAREYSENFARYNRIYELLNDVESKIIFEKIIQFRLTSNLTCLSGFKYLPEKQYFDPCVKFNDDEIFLDVGCFDGYTTQEFIKHCPSFKKVFIFEPDQNNLNIVRKNLTSFENRITYIEKGLSDTFKTLSFSSNGSSSKITEDGDVSINVCALDSLNIDGATYIKMDIEGGEYEALVGCRETIIKYRPKLAISVYHKINDFWEIPDLVLSFVDEYDLYLRHYTEGVIETVMYFIPKNSN